MLFESPWYGATLLLLLAAVAYVVLNRRGKFLAGLLAALAVAIAAAGLIVLASVIETPRERMRAMAAQLVGAVATADVDTLDGLLSDDARLVYFLSPAGMGKSEILGLVEQRFRGEYRVKEWSVLENQATMDGPEVGRVQIKVRVIAQDWNVPNVSWWKIDLRRDKQTQNFKITGIRSIAIAGVSEVN